MKAKLFTSAIILSLILSGCKGDKGDTGPAGTNGIANAHNQTITINPGYWIHFGSTGQSGDGYESMQSSSIITQEIVNNGVVLAYFSTNPSAGYIALPYTKPFSSYTRHFTYGYNTNLIFIDVMDSDFYTSDPGVVYGVIYLKVVTIAGSVMRDHPDLDLTNYSLVKATFNLND